MAFDYGVIQYKDLVNYIADKLLNSHGDWTDMGTADPGYWTGDEADLHFKQNGRWVGRCLKVVRNSETLYYTIFEPWYDSTAVVNCAYYRIWSNVPTSDYDYAVGVVISVSASYSMLDHILSSPIQSCPVCLGQQSSYSTHPLERSAMLDEYITYWSWTDEGVETNAGSGMVMIIKPNPWNKGYTQTAFFSIEGFHPNQKEYDDGFSNWWILSFPNFWQYVDDYCGASFGWVLHPFSHAHPWHSSHYYPEADHYYDIRSNNIRFGVFGIDILMRAYRSGGVTGEGDNKVRYSKPILHAHADYNYYPQLQLEHFIMWETEGGMVDGDILQEEGSNKKFLLLNKDSSSSTNTLPIGILYEV